MERTTEQIVGDNISLMQSVVTLEWLAMECHQDGKNGLNQKNVRAKHYILTKR